MLPVIQIGPLAAQTSDLMMLIGLWLGLTLSVRSGRRFGVEPERLYNLVIAGLVGALLGARLAYVLRYPAIFFDNPSSLISRNPGLLDPLGGLAGAALAMLIYGQHKRMSFWSTLDALTPALAVLALALGISHLASGAAFGSPTGLPWGIELWGARRHPAQIYEIVLAALILAAIWPGRGLIRPGLPGVYFLSFLALTAGAALLIEGFRGGSQVITAGLRRGQIAAWLALAASLYGIYHIKFASALKKEEQP